MRFEVPALDSELGIEVYLTDVEGIGGRIRSQVEDFVVDEIPQGASSVEEFISASLSRSPSRYEKYAVCLLEKHGIDTINAVSLIADHLHIKEDEIGYSGLKDAKAVTRQLISLPWRRPLQREYESPEGLRLQLLGFRYRPLSIGELYGNQFSITARKIELSQAELMKRLSEIEKDLRAFGGFPAYFGYQRFGSRRPISHLVGRMLHEGNPKSAVDTLLAVSREWERDGRRTARGEQSPSQENTKNSDIFPATPGVERRLLDHLHKHPKDHEGALKRLPHRLMKLFYDAYQSYIFNRALSLRLRERKSPTEIRRGELVASFDERGYVRKLTEVSSKKLAALQTAINERKIVPVLAVPTMLTTKSAHPVSPEVVSVLEDEDIPQNRERSAVGRNTTGIVRPIITEAANLGWITGDDDLNLASRKVTFHFRLRRGFYATILLREFMKSSDPLSAGF